MFLSEHLFFRLLAQTTLRNILGTKNLHEILSDRKLIFNIQLGRHDSITQKQEERVSNRWNGHFADSILGQHLSLRRKFSALNHSTISSPHSRPKKGCSIAKGFHFLHFPLNESYVRVRVFTHTHICIWIMHVWSINESQSCNKTNTDQNKHTTIKYTVYRG